MREILFRGKRTDNGEWIEGDLLQTRYHSGHIEYQIMPQTPVSSAYPVIPETVGQYTGLTDKNGKRIFEGDVVITRTTSSKFTERIEYSAEYVRFVCITNNDIPFPMDSQFKYEIIGNIHDNPELLGEEDT